MILALSTIIFILGLTWWTKKSTKPKFFPPGPKRYPLVGSVLELNNPWSSRPNVFWGVLQMEKKYGNYFGLYLGDIPTVVLTDLDDIKVVFNMEETHARPAAAPQNKLRPGWKEILEIDPELNKDRQPGVILSNVSFHTPRSCYRAK